MENTATPAATPAATSSTTPASTAATTQGPMSARDALAFADSSSATSATESPVATTPAAATVQPTDDGTAQTTSATPATGEPPKWRWQDILENARKTSAEEAAARVRQELETQYSGLRDFATLSADERAGLRTLHQAMNGDPRARAHVTQANPQLAASLGWVQAAAADPMPEADLQAQDGTLVYSAAQMKALREWDRRQMTTDFNQTVDQKLQPFQRVVAAAQDQESKAKAWTDVAQALQPIKADPDFETYKRDFAQLFETDPKIKALLGTNPDAATELAWGRIYREKILPAKQRASEGQVLANLQQRAVAGVTNPAAATPSAPTSTLGDARASLLQAESMMGAA